MANEKKTVEEKRVIPLNYPLVIEADENGQVTKIKQVTIGRLKVKHFKALPKDFMDRDGKIEVMEFIPLIAGMTGLTEKQVGEMDLEDLMEVAEQLQYFLAGFQTTGKA